MEFMVFVATLGGTALGFLIVAVAFMALWAGVEAKPLLLEQALRRQGERVVHLALSPGNHQFAVAVQRCLACSEAAQCRAWLASGTRDGYQLFCPNAPYIERMRAIA
jgi:hypothetical protein